MKATPRRATDKERDPGEDPRQFAQGVVVPPSAADGYHPANRWGSMYIAATQAGNTNHKEPK